MAVDSKSLAFASADPPHLTRASVAVAAGLLLTVFAFACGEMTDPQAGSPSPGDAEPNVDVAASGSPDRAPADAVGVDRDSAGGADAGTVEAQAGDESPDADLAEGVDGGRADADDSGFDNPDANVDGADSGPDTALDVSPFAPSRFTWAYDSKALCYYGPRAHWVPSAGDVRMLSTYSSTVSPPICDASTDQLLVESDRANTALDFAGGACWSSLTRLLPSLGAGSKAVVRIVARFPRGVGRDRHIFGLLEEPFVFLGAQRRSEFTFVARSRGADAVTRRVSAVGRVPEDAWAILDLHLVPAELSLPASVRLFVNGVATDGTIESGLPSLPELPLTIGYYQGTCTPALPRGHGATQRLLFLGMAIGEDAEWFDEAGEAHRRDCVALGLCL